MDILSEHFHQMNRRHFLSRLSLGLGSAALGSLLGCDSTGQPTASPLPGAGILDKLHFAPKVGAFSEVKTGLGFWFD